MRKQGPISERLRDYVRDRVRKDGAHYEWGNGTRLAERLGVGSGWVTMYTDTPPTAHATLDQSLTICDFYGLNLSALIKGKIREVPKPPQADPLAAAAAEAVEKFEGDRSLLIEVVNGLRRAAGLPAFEYTREQRRGRRA